MKIQSKLKELSGLRDVQISQITRLSDSRRDIDREKAGISGATVSQMVRSVVAATSSALRRSQTSGPTPRVA